VVVKRDVTLGRVIVIGRVCRVLVVFDMTW